MIRYIFLSGLVLLFSCQNTAKQSENKPNEEDVVASNDEPFLDNPTYEEMKEQYQLEYAIKQKIDTVFDYKDLPIRFTFEHLCVYDTLVIPARYSWSSTSQEDFVTHNYMSNLTFIEDQDTIAKVLIGKEVFEKYIDENLLKYGVLLYPSYEGFDSEKGVVQIHYSISIPLTDVGKGVVLNVGLDGSTVVND